MAVTLSEIRTEDLENIVRWRMDEDITRYMNTNPKLTLEGQKKWLAGIREVYKGEVYRGDLSSRQTMKAINTWAKERTQGLVKDFLASVLRGERAEPSGTQKQREKATVR